MAVSIAVFTRNLRVRDNPALAIACRSDQVVPLFVLDQPLVGDRQPLVGGRHGSANRLRFLCDALADLDRQLRDRDGALVVRDGTWLDEVTRLAAETGAASVHISDDVSHFARVRHDALRAAGERNGFAVESHPGVTVVAPGALRTGSQASYRVFTPYYRRWLAADWRRMVAAPRSLSLPPGLDPGRVPALEDLTTAVPSPNVIEGGETAALARMKTWARAGLARYPDTHNALAEDATSHASAFLHFGCLSPLEVATRFRNRPGGEAFVRQLCWRDFFHQLLAARPALAWEDMHDRGRPTGTRDAAFDAWREGRTGYPLVDAAMRQLRDEGFMHNRARMVVASFLTKDLDVPWQFGARHFMDLLVDGDVANNQLNWQWVAGTGTDANPHRIFNPIRQSERFDPDGDYIRRYVSELADVGTDDIHDPPAEARNRVGYPHRLVEHSEAVESYRARLTGSH